ncbi:MAG: hypothetical protein AAF653_08755 [Chloroflexota bacterium]
MLPVDFLSPFASVLPGLFRWNVLLPEPEPLLRLLKEPRLLPVLPGSPPLRLLPGLFLSSLPVPPVRPPKELRLLPVLPGSGPVPRRGGCETPLRSDNGPVPRREGCEPPLRPNVELPDGLFLSSPSSSSSLAGA